MPAATITRAARAASGLSQTELAQRSGIANSSVSLIEHGRRDPTVATLEALLAATRHSVVTIPTVPSDAARIAADIKELLADSGRASDAAAFRRFLQLADNLAAERGATKVGLTLTEPASTGSAQWDAAIAALCEYRLAADALPVPEWALARTGNPAEPWTPRTSRYAIPADPAQVPREFLSRGILIEAATLESV